MFKFLKTRCHYFCPALIGYVLSAVIFLTLFLSTTSNVSVTDHSLNTQQTIENMAFSVIFFTPMTVIISFCIAVPLTFLISIFWKYKITRNIKLIMIMVANQLVLIPGAILITVATLFLILTILFIIMLLT